ncbi:hypothetical protein V8C34DRAFT_139236 [Trichoderma compactum]
MEETEARPDGAAVASISAVDLREPGSAGGSLTGLLQVEEPEPEKRDRVHVHPGKVCVCTCAHSYQPRSHAVLTSSSAIRMQPPVMFFLSRVLPLCGFAAANGWSASTGTWTALCLSRPVLVLQFLFTESGWLLRGPLAPSSRRVASAPKPRRRHTRVYMYIGILVASGFRGQRERGSALVGVPAQERVLVQIRRPGRVEVCGPRYCGDGGYARGIRQGSGL